MAKLKRALGLKELTAYGVGIILGAGIYALIGHAAGIAGPAVWMSFLIGAVLASVTALSYIELGTLFPKNAAEFVYTWEAFKNKLFSFMIGFFTISIGVIASSVVALAFGGYLHGVTGIPIVLGSLGLVAFCGFLNFWGIEQSAKFNIVFTIVEVLGLLVIIILGAKFIGSVNYFEMPNGLTGVLSAAALIFFAYIGFEDMVNIAEEVKDPVKVLPKAFVLSILISSLIYILVALTAVSVIGWETLGTSSAPLADVAEAAMPGSGILLSIVALFATANTVLIILIVESRMMWGMARDKSLPKILSKIHKGRRTPWVAILLSTIIAGIFVLTSAITTIAQVTDLVVFLIFISVNVSLIALRYKKPNLKRPFKVPFNIGKFPVLPLLGILISIGLMTHLESVVYSYLGLIIVVGLFIYIIHEKTKS
ncbi:MAG: amino acid permease [Nanoarchaeota archaeon]|nr:amino acid permease [Nanoarchaeota archaeon]